ncbi:formylglycine-generating enzyme family protein [Marinobacter sp. 1Y8]
MRRFALLVPLFLMAACSSPSLTSETLSETEIAAIQSRVSDAYPELSSEKQQAVSELVVRALDNMVFVEGGSFMMGEFGVPCEPGSDDICMSDFDKSNDHAHKVVLDDYSLAAYETTIADFDLFREVHGKAPYAADLREREDRKEMFEADKPAWTKDWAEARDYCTWLGSLSDRKVDLPTEAQWEFAARNRGEDVLYATDNGEIEPGDNYPSESEDDDMLSVGVYPPNSLQIYDLNFNATEWVFDWFGDNYYENSDPKNPSGPDNGAKKVIRGGASYNTPQYNTTVARYSRIPDQDSYHSSLGFRCRVSSPESFAIK